MILLIPSYYAGWLRGEHYSELKTEYANCYSLSAKLDCLKETNGVISDKNPMINYWIENKLSIFGDSSFNSKNLEDLSYFEETWNKNDETYLGIGKIVSVNDISITEINQIKFDINTSAVRELIKFK